MGGLVTYFDPQPRRDERPARLPSPFAPGAPHPLARRAALALMSELEAGRPFPASAFIGENRGKMFGVLVVEDRQGRVGNLRAFSGMHEGSWFVDGFVGPTFDAGHRAAFWPAGQAELAAYDEALREITEGERATGLRRALADLDARHARAQTTLAAEHEARRTERKRRRAELADDPDRDRQLNELARQSQRDETAKRHLRAKAREERSALLAELAALATERESVRARQTARSCELLEQLFAGYALPNAAGERRSLRAIFAPATPPGGAGDCAAPKLFAHAFLHDLRPLALAEFWWGTPPAGGGRRAGRFYPACRGKCGLVLGFMLAGLDADTPPAFGGGPVAADEPRPVYDDPWLTVVDKPIGLLSVPGRTQTLHDSVLARLRVRHSEARGVRVVHRLDLDTSGLLLAAKDPATHAALQRQFWLRTVAKRYIAWLDGDVRGDEGIIELPLRVDLDDRPRQIHDPVHGKPATTGWRVLARADGRTRVAFEPHTGRTHQLRVHAAHPLGLGAPIVGDRLYGDVDVRLMLHAERLAFDHPHTGERVEFTSPAPF